MIFFSPYLFLLVVDILSRVFPGGVEKIIIQGIKVGKIAYIDRIFSFLMTYLFCSDKEESIVNLI